MARLCLFLASLFCALLPSPALAAMMTHLDLTSLALEADAIVRARVVSETREDPYTTRKTLEVVRSYEGPLVPGDRFELAYDLYGTHAFGDYRGADAGAPTLGPEVVVFLAKPRRHAPSGALRPPNPGDWPWYLVGSGLRIFLDGKAHRFVQFNNPGGFDPVPQGHDPYDLYDDPRGGPALDLAGLEAEMAVAQARAAEIRAAIAAPDGPARRERLVALAGLDEPPSNSSMGGFYRNTAAGRVLKALGDTHDLPSFLRALSRSSGVHLREFARAFSPAAVLEAASNPTLPLPLRLAALDLADAMSFELRELPSAEARVLALLSDADPDVRMRALSVEPDGDPSAARKAAVLRRWAIEPDPRVQLSLYDAAERYELRGTLRRLEPRRGTIVAAILRHDVLRIGWADLDEGSSWSLARSSRIVLQRGAVEESLPIPDGVGSNGGVLFRIPPTADTSPSEVTLHVELVDGKKHAAPVVRTFALGTYTPVAMALSVADAGTEADAAAPVATAAPTAPRRGCGCSAPGPLPSFGLLGLMLVPLVRRRSKRQV